LDDASETESNNDEDHTDDAFGDKQWLQEKTKNLPHSAENAKKSDVDAEKSDDEAIVVPQEDVLSIMSGVVALQGATAIIPEQQKQKNKKTSARSKKSPSPK